MNDPTLVPLFVFGLGGILSLGGLIAFGILEGRRLDRVARRRHAHHHGK